MLVYKNYVKPTELNYKKLHDIKFLYLQQYYNKLHKEGISESKIFNLNKVLRNFFNFCITNSYILANPTFRIVIPKDDTTENKEEAVDIFTDEEITAISKNSKNYMYYLFKLAMATGLRIGELLGLELNCIDLDNSEITVKQAVKTVNIFDDKNSSRREI
jgi:tyrosine recombinase xerC-like